MQTNITEKPPIRDWWGWHGDRNEIRSIDDSVIFRHNRLRWQTASAMEKAMKELVKDGGHGNENSIILEGKLQSKTKWITQIPYRKHCIQSLTPYLLWYYFIRLTMVIR
jgi:hypothetical protein